MFRRYDCHCHSRHSVDASDEITEIARWAMQNGLSGFCVTDHCDCEIWDSADYENSLQNCWRDVLAVRKSLDARLAISFGIELGQPLGHEEKARRILSLAPYDFVLLSIHNARDCEDFYDIPFECFSLDECYKITEGYFRHVCESVREWDDYDCLAHLTLPARYIWQKTGHALDLRRFGEWIETALHTLAERGKALELNMSGMRNGHGEAMPPLWMVKRFRELGGEHITIGSDSHGAETVGAYVEDGMRIAREAGFRYAAFYRERRPEPYRIV